MLISIKIFWKKSQMNAEELKKKRNGSLHLH